MDNKISISMFKGLFYILQIRTFIKNKTTFFIKTDYTATYYHLKLHTSLIFNKMPTVH